MNINKWGIRVSFILTLCSLLCAIFLKEWLQNFSFAILGSSILSFFICVVNYLVLRKEIAENIVISTYQINTFGYAELFSSNKDISLEKAIKVFNVLNDKYYYVYFKTNELLKGLFWFDCRKKYVNEIKLLIDDALIELYQMESFIEVLPEKAFAKTKKIYDDLDKLIDDNKLYLKTIKLAKLFFSKISSMEENIDKNELKTECAKQYEATLNN